MNNDGGFVKAGEIAQQVLFEAGERSVLPRQVTGSQARSAGMAESQTPASAAEHIAFPCQARFVKPLAQILVERPKLAHFFDATDREMAAEISSHVGEANGITVAQLAARFFPDDSRDQAARGIADRVRRMRRIAKLMVCSQRRAPGGYYFPANLEEWNRYRAEIWKHALAWLEICRDADHENDWVAEQLGQLAISWRKNDEPEK